MIPGAQQRHISLSGKGHNLQGALTSTWRYIGALAAIHNPTFGQAIEKIYPQLCLKEITGRATHLDRMIEIKISKLIVSFYDKRDDFPFNIQIYAHWERNVSSMAMYGGYISQLPCFCTACDSEFLSSHCKLLQILLARAFNISSCTIIKKQSDSVAVSRHNSPARSAPWPNI